MRKLLKIFIILTVFILVFLFCLMLSLSNSYVTSNYLLKAINKTFNVNIKAEEVKISFLHSNIEIKNLSYEAKDSSLSINNIAYIKANIDYKKLIKGKIYLKQLEIKNSQVSVHIDDKNKDLRESILNKLPLKNNDFIFLFNLDINNIHLHNFSLSVNIYNSNQLSIRDANIHIPYIRKNSILRLIAQNFSLNITNFDDFSFESKKSIFQLNTKLDNLYLPSDLNSSFEAENTITRINENSIKIPGIKIKSNIAHNNKEYTLNQFTLTEYTINHKPISNIKIKGAFTKNPLYFDLTLNEIRLSNNLSKILTALTSEKRYRFTDLTLYGRAKYKNRVLKSEGYLKINDFSCKPSIQEFTYPVNLKLNYSFCLNKKQQQLNVDKFGFTVTKYGNLTPLKINLNDSLEFIYNPQNYKILSKNFTLFLEINDFNLSNFFNFIPKSLSYNLKKIMGTLNSTIEISSNKLNSLNIEAKSKIKDLSAVTKSDYPLKNISINNYTALKILNLSKIQNINSETEYSLNDSPVLKSIINGSYNFRNHDASLALNLKNITPAVLNNLPISNNIKEHFLKFKNFTFNLGTDINLNLFSFPVIFKNIKLDAVQNNSSVVNAVITSPLELTFSKDHKYFSTDKFSSEIKFNGLEIFNIKNFFPNKDIPNTGKLYGKINAVSENKLNNLKITGKVDIKNLSHVSDDYNINNIDMEQILDFNVLNMGIVNIDKIYTKITRENNVLSEFNMAGTLSRDTKSYYLNLTNLYANLFEINKATNNLLQKKLDIKSLNLNGKIAVEKAKDKKSIKLSTELVGKDLKFNTKSKTPENEVLSGNINSNLIFLKNNVEINKLNIVLNSSKELLGQLNATGNISLPLPRKPSILNLNLDKLKLKKFLSIYNSIPGNFKLNLNGVDFDINFTANDLSYGNTININLHSDISKNKQVYSIRPIIAQVNGSNLFAAIKYDNNPYGNNSLYLSLQLSKLKINPFLKLYKPIIYDNSTGIIDKLNLSLSADNYSKESFKKLLTGKLNATVKDISLNDNVERFDTLRLLFLPFEMLSQTEQLISTLQLPIFFKDILQYSDRIFSNQSKLRFTLGKINLNLANQKISIDQLDLISGNPYFKSLKFTGSANLDKQLDLDTYITLNNYVTLPLHISGSLESPAPDIISLTSFIKTTILYTLKKGTFALVEFPEKIVKAISEDSVNAVEATIP